MIRQKAARPPAFLQGGQVGQIPFRSASGTMIHVPNKVPDGTISHNELTLWSLSNIREGGYGSPSLSLEKGLGDEFGGEGGL